MKKFAALALTLALLFSLSLPAAALEVPVEHAEAVTMVPLRAVAEALGYTVAWDGTLPGATLTRDEAVTSLTLGSLRAVTVSGADTTCRDLTAAPVFLQPGAIYVPAAFFAAEGVKVQPDGSITVTAPTVQVPNPIHSHDTLKALETAVGFPVPVPTPPAGFEASAILDIGGDLAELQWTDSVQVLTYRVTRGNADNSGDYTLYPETGAMTVNELDLQWRGRDGHIHLALWTDGGLSFSLRANDGLTENQLRQMVASIL